MPRTRTTKKLAQRIDLNYFREPHALRRWRFRLSLAALVLALAWLGWYAARRNEAVYSAGRLSSAHAVFSNRCSACHVTAGGLFFVRKVSDHACLDCHDGPIHQAGQTFSPTCASCHADHRGAIRLAEVSDANCTQCHANLVTNAGAANYFMHITSFASDHSEFAALRSGAADPTTIRFNHALHMQANLTGPTGPIQLVCGDCHKLKTYASASTSKFGDSRIFLPDVRMAAATYAATCATCHTLQFDKRFTDEVPHDTPDRIHAFVVAKFQAYIAAHPAELHELRDPNRDLPRRPVASDYRVLTPQEWLAEHTSQAEDLLWRKTCSECHAMTFSAGQAQPSAAQPNIETANTKLANISLPTIAPSNVTTRFFPLAKFDHAQHQLVTCESCHAAARSSQQSSDILLPGIATCRQCHNDGVQAAESRCFECHIYHDPAQRKFAPGHSSVDDLLSSLDHAAAAPAASRASSNL